MAPYTPRPVNTSAVTLPGELAELTEKLAKSTHDQWALQRFSDGWTHGPERDDTAKKHPCLLPYEDLPDSEKEYDRITALETLKAVLVLGFEIKRKQGG